ncbi:hypothetical protein [Nocardia brasiliensis]|uniref:hypothetical protein n=1 Tax=Nocardia brasiliensis TaxID=37326 RepID=UPI00367305C7
MLRTDSGRTVKLSECRAAVIRAILMTPMLIACPGPACGESVGLVDAVVPEHHNRDGTPCPVAGSRVLNDHLSREPV